MRARALLIAAIAAAIPANAAPRSKLPRAIGIEVLSKSVLYGLFYDQAIGERWVAGIGLTRTYTFETEKVTALIPLYGNYYLTDGPDFFASAGAIVVTNAGAVSGESPVLGGIRFTGFPLLPFLGAGYEQRGANGFLARAQANLTLSGTLSPSAGISLGYVF